MQRLDSTRPTLLACAALCASVLVQPAQAAIILEPQVTTGISRTNNLALTSSNRESETILQVVPSISLDQSSARLDSSVNYTLQAYYYAGRSDSNIYHRLDAQSRAALDRDNLFIDFGASRDQVMRDPSAPIPSGNLLISGNRTDRDEFYIGPSFRYPLADNIMANGSFRRTWVRFDDTAPGLGLYSVRDFEHDFAQVSLDNYNREQGITWATRYSAQTTDYGLFEPWEYRQASLELGMWIGRGFRAFGTVGKESAWDDPFDPTLEDDFWEAGFSQQAGERFSAEVAAGERTFGSSRRATVRFTFARGQTSLTYTQQPTTQGRETGGESLPGGGLGDLLNRPGAVERYISDRLQWNLSFNLRRTQVTFNAFDELREQRTRLDGLVLPDEWQGGGGFTATWQAGVRTSFSLSGQRVERELMHGEDRLYTNLGFGALYRLGTQTDVSLRFDRSSDKSKGNGFAGGYSANTISLLLTRRFWTPR